MAKHRFGPVFPRLFAAAIGFELAFSLLVHLPGYLSDLGATEGLIGVLYAVAAVVSLVFRPLLGRILDLTHRRTVILVAASMNLVVIFLLSTTSTWGPYLWVLFLLARTIQIALFTTMLTYGADAIPVERRTQGLAVFGLSGLIPIAVGGYGGDVLIDIGGFDLVFYSAVAVSFLAWLIVWTFPVLPVRGAQERRSFWAALGQKTLLPLWFATLMFAIGLESLFTFARTFVDDRQVASAGIIFAAYGLSAAVMRVAGGSAYDRLPQRPVITAAIAMYGAGFVLLAIADSVFLVVLASIMTGIAHGVVFPLIASEVVNRARVSERGSAMATFTSIFDIALLAGAPAVGFVIDGFNYTVAFSAVGIALLIGAFVYSSWDRTIDHSALVLEEVLE